MLIMGCSIARPASQLENDLACDVALLETNSVVLGGKHMPIVPENVTSYRKRDVIGYMSRAENLG